MRRRIYWSLAVVAGLALAACDSTPVMPNLEVDGDADAAVATTVLASWSQLISAEALELRTLEALADDNATPEAEEAILAAALFSAESAAASSFGELGSAEILDGWAQNAFLEVAISVFGVSVVDEVLGGVEEVLGQVERELAGRRPSPRMRQVVERTRELARSARSERSQGNAVGSLGAAVQAAASMQEADLEERAKHVVSQAHALLERATELAGPDPRPEIADALGQAGAHCAAARAALDSGDFREAIEEAVRCGRIARAVIRALSGGISDDRLQERAEAAVAHAQELFAQAVEAAGDDPRPQVAAALDKARDLLAGAIDALEAGEWREALRLARRSAALSGRVLNAVSGGRPGNGDDLADRAHATVDSAKELLTRVSELAGENPPPPVGEHLARAAALIGEAEAALSSGDWRVAIAKSHRAIMILRRIEKHLGG